MTARKRSESLQEIPIAVSAFSAEDLRDRGIVNIKELTKSVPSLQINEGFVNQIYIRGVGERTGLVRVDPTVGVYLDDLFIPRVDGQLLDVVDVEQVQILRGPQGTLFGKNTTGGAMILTLKKPTEEFGGDVSAAVGRFSNREVNGAVNLPITDNFNARLSVNVRKNDGFFDNLSDGSTVDSVDRQALLLQTRWQASDRVSNDTLLFYSKIQEDRPGQNCTVTNEQALFMKGLWIAWPGDTDPSNPTAFRDNCERNARSNTGNLETRMGVNSRLEQNLDTLMLGNTVAWSINENHAFKGILGISVSTEGPSLTIDTDGGPADFSENFNTEDSDRNSYSLEAQLNGSFLDSRLRYTGGLFYMQEENNEELLLLTGIAGLDAETVAQIANGEEPTQPQPGGTLPLVGVLTGPINVSDFELDNQTLASYLQLSYDLTPSLELTAGLRWTSEKREADLAVTLSDVEAIGQRIALHPLFGAAAEGFNPYLGPGRWLDDPARIAADLFPDADGDGIADFPLQPGPAIVDSKSKTFTQVTPLVSLSYTLPPEMLTGTVVDSTLVYVTWSNGFKSGFFEPRLVDGLQKVEPEELENFELGFKIEAFGRSLRLNGAVYSMTFENMQLIQVETDSQGNLAVIFDNAGKSEIEGVELEATWMPTPQASFNVSLSANSYEFVEFSDRDLLQSVLGNEKTIDRTDEDFPVSPENTLALGFQYTWPTKVGDITSRWDASYKSEVFLGLDRGSFEAFKRDADLAGQEAYWLIDFRLAWHSVESDITVAAFVKNLTDERYTIGGAVGDSIGVFFKPVGDPRTYGLQVRREF